MAPRKRKMKKWTTKLDNQIIALRAQGMSNAKIGEKIGRSAGNVAQRCTHLRKQGADIAKGSQGRPTRETAPAAVKVAEKVLANENANKADPSTPLTEMAASLAKLTTYVSMLEAQNASLQRKLNEIQQTLRE